MTPDTQNSSTFDPEISSKAAQNSTMPDRLRPYAFKKGQSGNPGGRPRKSKVIRSVAERNMEKAFGKIVQLIDSKDDRVAIAACNAILDRALGKPLRTAEITAKHDIAAHQSEPVSETADWIRSILDQSESDPTSD